MLKDLFDAEGMPTFAGSSFLPEVRPAPASSSRIVRELAAAGAVLAGKTHLFEFAWGLTGENAHYGDCEHPGFPGRTTGGSSSGSAAAVAAGVVPLAIGTDTGGSIRVPAAFCGLFGYRCPPRTPLIADAVPLSPSYDAAGWLTRTAGDMRTATAVLAGMRTSERVPRGCYLEMPGLDPEVARACLAASSRLAPPADAATGDELRSKFASAAEVYGVLTGTEAWRFHRKWADRHRARYGPLVQDRLDRARSISPAQVAAVESSRASLVLAWTRFFLAYDFLVMAAAPFPALAPGDFTAANRLRMLGLTAPASVGGLPALAVPVPLPSGMTAGLQVVFSDPQSPVVPWVLGTFA
jgi:amidase/aspartyl-tRNA(Asn)/glutamyl-tRNA(Gln) amidotransferase subunit A